MDGETTRHNHQIRTMLRIVHTFVSWLEATRSPFAPAATGPLAARRREDGGEQHVVLFVDMQPRIRVDPIETAVEGDICAATIVGNEEPIR